ncbi:helix-turn-helix transcriptional regulator [Zhongshania borealis]|uniref:HTH cro/C1-type domain-containing protein n=1 Tax=Zhongshania borealis TaxID=889488 RepID=A0ABP7WMR3_9GAMM
MNSLPPRRQLTWNAREQMELRGLDRHGLRDALVTVGVRLSYSQVCRLVSDQPGRLSLSFLEGLVTVLGCTPGQLISEHRRPIIKPGHPTTINLHATCFDFPSNEDAP